MSKDYKGSDRRHGPRRNGSSLLAGILIGLVLGLALALGVAWYINKMPSPFANRSNAPAKSETKGLPSTTARVDEKAGESKPRFDFYKILPGDEAPGADKQRKDVQTGSTAPAREAFYLQAGAFQNAPDADNVKARLALLGVEASIETSAVPDKGVLHRVRIGPYTSVEDVNRTRDTLKQNGVQTTLVKVREPER
jgi:cell division protein FtsN